MTDLPYNQSSQESILNYALQLVDKSLREVIGDGVINQKKLNKGNFGQLVEKHYFFKDLDSASQPDFLQAELELKTSSLRMLKKKGQLRAKERLSLNIINYEKLIEEDFITSSVYTKNKSMLLIFSLDDGKTPVLDRIIKLVGIWSFPAADLKVIERDWQFIKNKVIDGEAHTLSEGDTLYLGAARKGGKTSKPRPQPNSSILVNQRAFSLKPGYVNHILAKISGINDGSFGQIATEIDLEEKGYDIEQIVLDKFLPFYGRTPIEIAKTLNVTYNNVNKQMFSSLTKAILGVSSKQDVEEFSKAEITVRTVRINKTNLPCESTSFPAFVYEELVKEDSWELSKFNELLEKRFLFVFFKSNENCKKTKGENLFLDKVLFWNMPYIDREEAKLVWENTKKIIADGRIVKEVKPKRRETYFPKSGENRVAHVRPHATTTKEVYPLPTPDKLTKVTSYTRHSFWLNNTYIRDSIYLNS